MHGHINPKNHQPAPLVADDVYDIIMKVLKACICIFLNPSCHTIRVLEWASKLQPFQLSQVQL